MYAILTALEAESDCFIEKTSRRSVHKWNSYKFIIGTFAGQECIVGHTGMGKVQAAVAVSHIIENFHPGAVFYTGIAGSLKFDLNIGDVVIAQDSMQWDIDISLFGFKPGELPEANSLSYKKSDSKVIKFYKTDSELLKKSEKWIPGGFKVIQGRIITGDSFFNPSLQQEKISLVKEIGADAVDMEGAAAGLACKMNNVPFFLARVISDTPDDRRPKSFKKFLKKSSAKMAELVDFVISSNFS